MPHGTIKKVIADKGFGFIEGERGDMFFHHSAVEGTSIEALRVGQQVQYDEGRGPKGFWGAVLGVTQLFHPEWSLYAVRHATRLG